MVKELREGKTVCFEGARIKQAPGDIEVGDWYVAERITGPKLLTAHQIHPDGYIVPRESAYPFNISECVKVELT